MNDFDEADIRQMRREGSLRDFLRLQATSGAKPATKPERRRTPGHRPGAWPPGTRPPDPLPRPPDAVSHAAIAEYREWIRRGRPPGDFRCDCGCVAAPTDQAPRSQ